MNTNWNDKYHALKLDSLITKCREYSQTIGIVICLCILFLLCCMFLEIASNWIQYRLDKQQQEMEAYKAEKQAIEQAIENIQKLELELKLFGLEKWKIEKLWVMINDPDFIRTNSLSAEQYLLLRTMVSNHLSQVR